MHANRLDHDFASLEKIIHTIGKDVVQPAALEVDRDARFPIEAFNELKRAQMLSCYIPTELGGMGLNIKEVAKLCEILGGYDASTAMIFAMHQIQIACIVHHSANSDYFKQYLRDVCDQQFLLASATTELGVGGDLRSSLCAVTVDGNNFTLNKEAPVISYGEAADAIMVTCRRAEDASSSDQVQVLVFKEQCELTALSDWDTLGYRGTCSKGFSLKSSGKTEQIQPAPFAEILSHTMHPVSHLLWGSLWLGLAQDAVNQARSTVRAAARKTPDTLPTSALRLTELDEMLFSMRSGLYQVIDEYQQKLFAGDSAAHEDFGSAIRVNNVKLRCSEQVVEIVSKALVIVGINGYKNDHKSSLARHLRDAFGSAIMVNNDRIRNHNATMQIMSRNQ
jgi:acyl-CoA dehydrogenase